MTTIILSQIVTLSFTCPPMLDRPNSIYYIMQIIKILSTQLYPSFCYSTFHKLQYPPQFSSHTFNLYSLQRDPSFTPIQSHSFVSSGFKIYVKWVRSHHGMARPRVADRGDSLQICGVAVNTLNKQSWTADSGWSSSLRVGGANNPHHKTQTLLRNITHRLLNRASEKSQNLLVAAWRSGTALLFLLYWRRFSMRSVTVRVCGTRALCRKGNFT
jgi:hypothetical protein